jgi:hypothetical protein
MSSNIHGDMHFDEPFNESLIYWLGFYLCSLRENESAYGWHNEEQEDAIGLSVR